VRNGSEYATQINIIPFSLVLDNRDLSSSLIIYFTTKPVTPIPDALIL
jgi:hypothetical protein